MLFRYFSPLLSILLFLLTATLFFETAGFDFINIDDPLYVYENEIVLKGITWENIIWAFKNTSANIWHPLTWLSYIVETSLFGPGPTARHLTNVFLHSLSSLVLFTALHMMTGAMWRSFFVALLFAVHPLRVESVAWISERKDVLSTFFWMVTVLSYGYYVKRPNVGRYLFILLFFMLGLMSKPMLVTLPFVLLLLDFWPIERFIHNSAQSFSSSSSGDKRKMISNPRSLHFLIIEKVPLILLALIMSTVAYFAQEGGGALASMENYPLLTRVANAMTSYILYIYKMLFPLNLAVYYPFPPHTVSALYATLSGLLLLFILVSADLLSGRSPYLLVGFLWYTGTLVPVIGLVQIGSFSMADRFTYIPSIGLSIALVWGFYDITSRFRFRIVIYILAGVTVFALLTNLTHLQLKFWRNSITLLERTIEVTKDNYLAHYNLGAAYEKEGMPEKATPHYLKAIKILPTYFEAHNNLAILLAEKGEIDVAARHFMQAIAANPQYAEAFYNLGLIFEKKGSYAEAAHYYSSALKVKPKYPEAYNALGHSFFKLGRDTEAAINYTKAIHLNEQYGEAYNNLGILLASRGDMNEAVRHFARALQIDPEFSEVHYNLAILFLNSGKLKEAEDHLKRALQTDPENVGAKKLLDQVMDRRP